MGMDKQGSKGGNYVGGFLQMFDWNAKSRKKLFSSKSDVPEQSKQKKRCDGNFPMTRLHMLDADENAAGSSVKGSSDYSCSSSVIDEDFCEMKAPGVVARLMGLDSLPKSSMHEPYCTPLFNPYSLRDSFYGTKSLEYCQDQIMQSSEKVMHRPIEKFQTEVLPPKSAKSIPITHHKLLSPIKSGNFVASKDAARMMEAAARIIDSGPQERLKKKQPSAGSSSAPLRVLDLKEKVQAAQKPSKVFEGSQRKVESNAVKNLRGHSMNKNWKGSVDAKPVAVIPDSEESSVGGKNKGKSISLALQAKANVQKREGLNVSSSRNPVSQKEPCELSLNHLFKSQSMTQKSNIKKLSAQNGSSVLRQNNQKQNCIVDKGKLPSKCNSKGGKTLSGESSSVRQQNSSKLAGTSKVNSRKLIQTKDNKREVLSSTTERVTSKKRSVDGNYHSGKNQATQEMEMDKNGKANDFCFQDSGRGGTDVVSFTFTAPMMRSGHDSWGPTDGGDTCKMISSGYQSKRTLLSSGGMSAPRFSNLGHNVKGGDALSILLEQKLKELARKVEFSQQKSGTHLQDMVPGLEDSMSSTMVERNEAKDGMYIDDQGVLEEMSTSDGTISQARKLLDHRLPSPVSVLEQSPFSESCNSTDTAESNSTAGSKLSSSSIQAQEVLDSCMINAFGIERDADLSDSASSTSARRQEMTTLTFTNSKNLQRWELEYVKEILCNIEPMFMDYALGISNKIITPLRFDQMERSKDGVFPSTSQRILFDCINECLDLQCRRYASGGYILWAKGVSMVRRKEKLAEEIYKEISGWSANIGESMIDELVDKDMSSQRGRWVDFGVESFEIGIQIESQILGSLIDEVVADILVL